MNLPRVVVMTSDKYIWAVRPFAHLFNQYWASDWPVTIAGYSPPDFRLPKNFSFFQIDTDNYPPERWSDGLLRVLDNIRDSFIILMLEDYWLVRPVDLEGVTQLCKKIATPDFDSVIRFDLTNDRAHARGDCRGAEEWGTIGHYDIVETNHTDQYQMSFQAAIWNRLHLRTVTPAGKTPWQLELYSQFPSYYRVLGTKQRPVRYCNAVYKGKLDKSQLRDMPEDDFDFIKGWIPEGIETTMKGLLENHD
jgi:hypothetical protein